MQRNVADRRAGSLRLVRALTIVDRDLVVADRPDPTPGPGQVLVRVHAAGLNRADLAQRAGHYPAPPGWPADIPGMEFAGEVVAIGDAVTTPGVGTRVFGIAGGGAQAELLAVPAVHCTEIPAGLDAVHAGGVPEVFITAHDAMITQAQARAGETVLVHAAGSGVGTAAVQLARAWNCTSVGTSRTADKLERCRALGLDHAIVVPREVDPVALADEITAAAGPIDVTIDLVGGPYLGADVRAAAVSGRIVLVASQAGARAELDIGSTMFKRLRIHGTVLRARSVDEKAAATAAFARDVVPRLADGTIAPVVAETFPLESGARAYDLLAADGVFGKLVLDLTG
jgi:putative PIG3 family NAD(P)H quinone oxidoreductase